MRYFRIPAFSGIEAHRDDADRGSLRVVEGCFPLSTGGMSSGPVWEDLDVVDPNMVSPTKENFVSVKADSNENSFIFASRKNKIHDMHVMLEPRTVVGELEKEGLVYISDQEFYQRKVYFNSIGNRTLMIGEGSADPLSLGKGPPSQQGEEMTIAPDFTMYGQEWKVFKRCKYFLVGPNKCIFAAGNCLDPLAVYVSEPAGLSNPNRDSPYSNFAISRVNILMSNATLITGLSLKGTQVIVHTDTGCHLLYASKGTQASTGYRVEQRPTSVASAAASNMVVNRGYGTSPLWLGQDGHIYKDESAAVGQEDQEKNTDKDQATYKSKGAYEHELPQDLSDSFAVYDASSGTYIVYVKSKEFEAWQKAHELPVDSEEDFVCPADEDDEDSDTKIVVEPNVVPEPDPVIAQPPEEPEPEQEPPEIQVPTGCGIKTELVSGGNDPWEGIFEVGQAVGDVSIEVEAFQNPDRFIVEWDGKEVIDTNYLTTAINDPVINQVALQQGWTLVDQNAVGKVFTFRKDKALPDYVNVKVVPSIIPGTAWEFEVKCVVPKGEQPPTVEPPSLEKCFDLAMSHGITGGHFIKQGYIIERWWFVDHVLIDCLCDLYDKSDEFRQECQDILTRIHEFDVTVWVTKSVNGSHGGAHGRYWSGRIYAPDDIVKAAEADPNIDWTFKLLGSHDNLDQGLGGTLQIEPHTIRGFGQYEPMEKFLETLRHEGVHAWQDAEGDIELGGGNNFTLMPLADEGVIWTQKGFDEAQQYKRMPGETDAQYEFRKRIETEGNSVELSKELTELAYELIGPRDS